MFERASSTSFANYVTGRFDIITDNPCPFAPVFIATRKRLFTNWHKKKTICQWERGMFSPFI
jgi:hypothetical protein